MNILLNPTYFANILHWCALVKSNQVSFEVCDSYQKQTYRNRTHIYSANGTLALSIPVVYSQNNRQMYRDIEIYNNDKWQNVHWKSLISAYGASPFFEFYKDSLEKIYLKKYTDLTKFNFDIINLIFEWIEIEIKSELSKGYNIWYENSLDLRKNIENKRCTSSENIRYRQVFSNKNGFLNDLSIMDLIFNEGPNSISYLK